MSGFSAIVERRNCEEEFYHEPQHQERGGRTPGTRAGHREGESVTRAVTVALKERLDRLHDEQANDQAAQVARIRSIVEDSADRWVEPYRSADHGDLLYDEAGLPR